MEAYLYLFAIMVLCQIWYYATVRKKSNIVKVQRIDKRIYVFCGILVTLLLATRTETVGTDTVSYVAFFHDHNFYYHGEPTDFMFEMLSRFFHVFNDSTEWFIFCTGVFSLLGVFYLINKTAEIRSLSLLLFVLAGSTFVYYQMYFNAIRQCCAFTFYFTAICFWFKERRSKNETCISIILMVLAVLTHGSSLFGVPFILFATYKPITNKKVWYAMIIGFYILCALNISYVQDVLQYVFGFLGQNKYEGYADVNFGQIEMTGNRFFNMFLLPFTLISCMLVYLKDKDFLSKWWMQLFLWGVAMNNFFSDNLMWGRLLFYLIMFSIIAIPNALKNEKKLIKIPFYILFIAYLIYKNTTALAGSFAHSFENGINTNVPYHSWLLPF